MRKVAVFDLDLTFVSINSTYEFIRYYFNSNNGSFLKRLYFRFFDSAHRLGVPMPFGQKRQRYLRFLKGEKKSVLTRAASSFVEKKMVHYVNSLVNDKLKQLKEQGFYCVLASSSFDFVVFPAVRCFGFDDGFGSSLAFNSEGQCEGQYETDLRGKKETLIRVLESQGGALDRDGSYFFTDNKEDLPLAKIIGHSFGVVAGGIRKRFWIDNGICPLEIIPVPKLGVRWWLVPSLYTLCFRASVGNFFLMQVGLPVVALLALHPGASVPDVFGLFVGIGGYVSFYEIGYFLNDYSAVTREENPSLRFSQETGHGLWRLFCLSRVCVFTLFCMLLAVFFSHLSVKRFVVANILTLGVFLFHNHLPQSRRYGSYLILKVSHFLVPLSLFTVHFAPLLITAVVTYVPIPFFRYMAKSHPLRMRACLGFFWGLNVVFLVVLCLYGLRNSAQVRPYWLLTGFFYLTNVFNFGETFLRLFLRKGTT